MSTPVFLATTLGLVLIGPSLLTIGVERGPIKIAPADIRLRVRIEPDAANRTLMVIAESETFRRGSGEDLHGRAAPLVRWIDWRDVPAGEYQVLAEVNRGSEVPWRARSFFIVVGELGRR